MEQKFTLVQHLEEIRKRIIICLIVIFTCSIFCFFYTDKILLILSKPIGKLIFINPAEAFFTRIKLSFYGAIFISMPVIIYQVWKFINPGLIEIERRYFYKIIPFSYLLFISGVIFAFIAVLPFGIKILLSYGTENIQPMISLTSYISFVTIFIFAFGIIFQLPIIIFFMTKIGIITPEWLVKNRRYAILIIFILSGILTPGPDIFSQFLMAIPTLILYEMSILISRTIK